ncbi:hypothetical protein AbraIFM66951_005475 [Aspergillus brasiliensis]|uniref:Uncharacterized protein n=1 Tax=Aspergillus brasiliensis TaxID=319629 RepID=A0A9W6DUS5_9EURO|nr:hypothetical protein AbraCBS73388_006214 [Aspergillus brasiliensis]GKZ51328.1 hypothetical protein AbraIFM66951_005475 [Aspergillus brasiliensis]
MTPTSLAAWFPEISLQEAISRACQCSVHLRFSLAKPPPESIALASRRPPSVSSKRKLSEPRGQEYRSVPPSLSGPGLACHEEARSPDCPPQPSRSVPPQSQHVVGSFFSLLLAKRSGMSSGDKLVATSRMPTWDVSLVDLVPCVLHWLLFPRIPRMITFVVVKFVPGLVWSYLTMN